jgi:hypothetical protein
MWHLSPAQVREIGFSLRKRMVERKGELERKREQKMKEQAARAKSRSRR